MWLTGIVVGSANERRRYNVTSSLTGWAHVHNDPWLTVGVIKSDTMIESWFY